MIVAWIRTHLWPFVLIVVLAILAAVVGWNLWQSSRSAKTQVEVSKGQAGAAVQSGRDAVDTVGNRMDADAKLDQQTRNNDADIRQVPGASATVSPADRDAFLRILCRKPGRAGDPKCVQLANSK